MSAAVANVEHAASLPSPGVAVVAVAGARRGPPLEAGADAGADGAARVPLRAHTAKRTRRALARPEDGRAMIKMPPLRGHTCKGRLRLVDGYLRRRGGAGAARTVAVDVGFGDEPWTALEMAEWLPDGAVLYATDVVADRVARAAKAHAARRDDVRFVTSDASFALPAPSPTLVRCANVLRDLHAWDAAAALRTMHRQLAPGEGVLVDASTDATGHLACALVLLAGVDACVSEVVFAVDASATAAGSPPSWFEAHLFPRAFAARAPAEHEHGGRAALLALLAAWRAVCSADPLDAPAVDRFDRSARRLASSGLTPGAVAPAGVGLLVWRPALPLRVPTYHPLLARRL